MDQMLHAGSSAEAQPLRVLVVDDHPVICDALQSLLERGGLMTVVGRVYDGHEALEEVAPLQPEIVLLDFELPGMGGLATARHLHLRHPEVLVVLMNTLHRPSEVAAVTEGWLAGVLAKDEISAACLWEIVAAQREAAAPAGKMR